MADVLVIGAGVGGLSAAIALAARGLRVEVIEAGERPGGKVGIRTIGGVEVDTGPSVLTLPGTLDRTLRLAGTSLGDEIELLEPEPSFRYLYPDGVRLDIHARPDRTLSSVERTLGRHAADELAAFLDYSRRIWGAAAPHFVFGPAPSLPTLLGAGGAIFALPRIDPLRTMWGAIRRRVRSPHLRLLLARYATYNGSDVRRAPATLNCIAHVELALGGYGVRGGMYEVVRALVRAAERAGAGIHCGTRVRKILVSGDRAVGVETDDGRRWRAGAVVGNADAAHVLNDLLPRGVVRSGAGTEPSMSGWVAVLRARRQTGSHPRTAHTVLFPQSYMQEFSDIFDHGRPPREPTVYLCAQEVGHGRTGWADHEPLFLMANAPAEPQAKNAPAEPAAESALQSRWSGLRQSVLDRLDAAGLRGPDDSIVFERTPSDLAAEFPGSRGSIYGAASNGPFAAFRRPPNRVRGVRGLYLASGSAHPGGVCRFASCRATPPPTHCLRTGGSIGPGGVPCHEGERRVVLDPPTLACDAEPPQCG